MKIKGKKIGLSDWIIFPFALLHLIEIIYLVILWEPLYIGHWMNLIPRHLFVWFFTVRSIRKLKKYYDKK